MSCLLESLKSLETAEDFLEHFDVPFDQRVVDVNRLHILQRLHDRLAESDLERMDDARLHETVSTFLERAYQDFVESDARTEKVFKVFHQADQAAKPAGKTLIPLAEVSGVTRPDKS